MGFSARSQRHLHRGVDQILEDVTKPNTNGRKSGLVPGVIAGVTDAKSTVYLKGYGTKNTDTNEPIDVDNQLSLFSCTKSMTVMGILILWEEGKISLDAPAKNYLPLIDDIRLIEKNSVDKEGNFTIEPKKSTVDITIKHLMLHTAGFSYAFMNRDYMSLAKKDMHINVLFPTKKLFNTNKFPLISEPGTKWNYGHNTDWLGIIIEEVSGQRLGEFLKDRIFKPANMNHTAFLLENNDNLVMLHVRKPNKEVKLMKSFQVSLDPEIDMGGQGGFGTVGDYLKFIRIWLNYGKADNGNRILNKSTVEYVVLNHLPLGLGVDFSDMGVKNPPGWKADGFTLTGNAYNMNQFPTGRPRGVLYWSGLANLYYWIDMKNQIGGFWGSQIMPYMDMYSLLNYAKFELKVYDVLKENNEEKRGSKI